MYKFYHDDKQITKEKAQQLLIDEATYTKNLATFDNDKLTQYQKGFNDALSYLHNHHVNDINTIFAYCIEEVK